MYILLYLYPVPKDHVPEFLSVERRVLEIFRRYGCVSDAIFRSTDPGALYGCLPLSDAVVLQDGEELFVGITTFHDLEHRDDVMQKFDQDSEVQALYNEFCTLVDIKRVVRGEFEQAL